MGRVLRMRRLGVGRNPGAGSWFGRWPLGENRRVAATQRVRTRTRPDRSGRKQPRRPSTGQLARQYALVALLVEAKGNPRPVDALARDLMVSERTIERDLEHLRAARLPLRGRGGARGGVWLDVTRHAAPPELSPAQIAALLVSLDHLGVELPTQFQMIRDELLRQLTGPRLF